MADTPSSEQNPLVSVITPVYNGEKHLKEALSSVSNQSYQNIEHIIVDAESDDGTPRVINHHAKNDAIWIREPDDGIYHGMNKGISNARGKYIGILNADDILYSNAIKSVVENLERFGDPAYTCGPVELIDEMGNVYGRTTPLPPRKRQKRKNIEMPCPHLSVFVHKDIYINKGHFNTNFKLSADYDFLLRLMESETPSVDLKDTVGAFRKGGTSGWLPTWRDNFRVLRHHYLPIWYCSYVFLRSATRGICKKHFPFWVTKNLKRYITTRNNEY